MINFFVLQWSKVCHAFRVNRLKKIGWTLAFRWSSHCRSAFGWFGRNRDKDHRVWHKIQLVSNYVIEFVAVRPSVLDTVKQNNNNNLWMKNPPSYIARSIARLSAIPWHWWEICKRLNHATHIQMPIFMDINAAILNCAIHLYYLLYN